MMDIFILRNNKLSKGKINDISKRKGMLWIDITNIDKEETEFLQKKFNLHPLTLEDLSTINTRIKVEEFEEYMFCVFYGSLWKNKFESFEIDFALGNDFLITSHKISVASFEDLKKDNVRLEKLMTKGADFLFHRLLDIEIDNFLPVLEKMEDKIEDIQEEATSNPSSQILSKILHMKRQVTDIRKIAYQLRDKISFLAKNDYHFISENLLPYFRDVYDHTIRVHDSVDNQREAIANGFDLYMSAVSNNMNEVMKMLSIIATIALPLTVISGLYGTNFINLPGSKYYYGFWIMVIVMVLMVVGMLVYFKRKRWL